MAKQYLYAFKGLQEMPTLMYLTKRLHNMYITEKAIAYKKTKVQNLKRNGNFILDVQYNLQHSVIKKFNHKKECTSI